MVVRWWCWRWLPFTEPLWGARDCTRMACKWSPSLTTTLPRKCNHPILQKKKLRSRDDKYFTQPVSNHYSSVGYCSKHLTLLTHAISFLQPYEVGVLFLPVLYRCGHWAPELYC